MALRARQGTGSYIRPTQVFAKDSNTSFRNMYAVKDSNTDTLRWWRSYARMDHADDLAGGSWQTISLVWSRFQSGVPYVDCPTRDWYSLWWTEYGNALCSQLVDNDPIEAKVVTQNAFFKSNGVWQQGTKSLSASDVYWPHGNKNALNCEMYWYSNIDMNNWRTLGGAQYRERQIDKTWSPARGVYGSSQQGFWNGTAMILEYFNLGGRPGEWEGRSCSVPPNCSVNVSTTWVGNWNYALNGRTLYLDYWFPQTEETSGCNWWDYDCEYFGTVQIPLTTSMLHSVTWTYPEMNGTTTTGDFTNIGKSEYYGMRGFLYIPFDDILPYVQQYASRYPRAILCSPRLHDTMWSYESAIEGDYYENLASEPFYYPRVTATDTKSGLSLTMDLKNFNTDAIMNFDVAYEHPAGMSFDSDFVVATGS